MDKLKVTIFKEVVEDNYNKGEIGERSNYGLIDEKIFNSYIELSQFIKEYSYHSELYFDSNNIEFSLLEDIYGFKVDEYNSLYDEFVSGNINLYNANYFLSIIEITENKPSEEKIREVLKDEK